MPPRAACQLADLLPMGPVTSQRGRGTNVTSVWGEGLRLRSACSNSGRKASHAASAVETKSETAGSATRAERAGLSSMKLQLDCGSL